MSRKALIDKIKEIRQALRTRHHLRPVLRTTLDSDSENHYVEIRSRHVENNTLQRIHIEVNDQEHAAEVIDLLSKAIKTSNDLCVTKSFYEDVNVRFASRPRKLDTGCYEYRGYEIVDYYMTDGIADGGSKRGRWHARRIPFLDNETFGTYDRLMDAMYYIDRHLEKDAFKKQ